MNLPRFTAGASLNAMSGQLQLCASLVQAAQPTDVVPAIHFEGLLNPCRCVVPDPVTGYGGRWYCCTRSRATGLTVCRWEHSCHPLQTHYPGNLFGS